MSSIYDRIASGGNFRPLGSYVQGEQLAEQRSQNRLASMMNQAKLEQMQQEQQNRNKLAPLIPGVMSGDQQATQQAMAIDPNATAKYLDAYGKMNEQQRKDQDFRLEQTGRALMAVKNAQPEQQPQIYAQAREYAIQHLGANPASIPEQYDPAYVEFSLGRVLSVKDQLAQNQPKYTVTEIGAGGDSRQKVFVDTNNPSARPIPVGAAYTRTADVQIGVSADNTPAPGMPQPYRAPWDNVQDPKKRDEAKIRYGMDAQNKLEKEEKEFEAVAPIAQDLQRFMYLNEETTTGAVSGAGPVAAVRGVFDDDIKEMQSIVNKLTPAMRQGMPGAASDRDVVMFKEATVGTNKPKEVNANIATGMMSQIENKRDRQAFMREFYESYGHLNGAERAWDQYLESNPIFDPNAPKGSYKLNERRKSYREYFGGQQQGGGQPDIKLQLKQKYGLE